MSAAALALSLLPTLEKYIQDAFDQGAKDEREAKRIALQRLVDEHELQPVLPTVEQKIADARRPAAERDAVVAAPLLPSHQPDTDAETTKPG